MWRYKPGEEGEYVGNIWGWKFSIFGAILIVVMLIIAALTAHLRDKPLFDNGGFAPAPAPTESSQ